MPECEPQPCVLLPVLLRASDVHVHPGVFTKTAAEDDEAEMPKCRSVRNSIVWRGCGQSNRITVTLKPKNLELSEGKLSSNYTKNQQGAPQVAAARENVLSELFANCETNLHSLEEI